ncbi:MAG: hypothetical protein SOX45_09940 [Lachnospiraceae bacterium]|nr:hypothetical protein [Lachnospiraceae bacterium]
MFAFLKGSKKNKELEAIIARIDSNVSNNYKDAAQDALREFEDKLQEFIAAETLNDKQKTEYESRLALYRDSMKEFTHKDQKPYWN